MTRIMVCDARPDATEGLRIVAALNELGVAVDYFSEGPRFIEATVAAVPAVVVYALGAELETDLGLLRLLRRMQPGVELVLIADQPSLAARVAVQALRPMFCSVGALDPGEVTAIVQAVVRRKERLG